MLIQILRQLVCGRDTFIRHLCVRELLRQMDVKTVIDVGGEGRLGLFIRNARVSTANVHKGEGIDHLISGKTMPFADASFDAAVSVDTLEHLPGEARPHFIEEMFRVSRIGIIVCAPLGTPQHNQYEKQLLVNGVVADADAKYLQEHVDNGLPTPDEVASLASKYHGSLLYQGDFRGHVRGFKHRIYNLIRNLITNLGSAIFWNKDKILNTKHTPYTNRFFLVAFK